MERRAEGCALGDRERSSKDPHEIAEQISADSCLRNPGNGVCLVTKGNVGKGGGCRLIPCHHALDNRTRAWILSFSLFTAAET